MNDSPLFQKWLQLFCWDTPDGRRFKNQLLKSLQNKSVDLFEEFGNNTLDFEVPSKLLTEFNSCKIEARREETLAKKLNCSLYFFWQKEFPYPLKQSPYCPLALYIFGNYLPSDHKAMALVGTRTPTPYGDYYTHRFAHLLAEAGITVVSGLAQGIDQRAHETTLQAGGRTLAVLGQGIQSALYNSQIKRWLFQIATSGAVMSQFPLKMSGTHFSFPMRNKIISGLSQGLILTESRRQGGAMITSKYALQEGKEIFSLLGPIHSPCSEGPNYWVSQGAQCLISELEFKEQMQIFLGRRFQKPSLAPAQSSVHLLKKPISLTQTPQIPEPPSLPQIQSIPKELRDIYEEILKKPQSLDLLSEALNLPTPQLQSKLVRLEMGGWIKSQQGGIYRSF